MNTSKGNFKPPCPKLRGSVDNLVYPVWASPKFDGEFTWLIKADGETKLVNKYGLVRTNCMATRSIDNHVKKPLVLIGELVYDDGMKGALYDLLRNKTSDSLRFIPFDIVSYDIQDLVKTKALLIERLEIMSRVLGSTDGQVIQNHQQLDEYYRRVIDNGYEGIVAKTLNGALIFGTCDWVKLKEKDVNQYPILSIDQTQERIEVGVPTASNGVKKVGVKVSNSIKRRLNVGDLVNVQHQGILSGDGLRHPTYGGKA